MPSLVIRLICAFVSGSFLSAEGSVVGRKGFLTDCARNENQVPPFPADDYLCKMCESYDGEEDDEDYARGQRGLVAKGVAEFGVPGVATDAVIPSTCGSGACF